MESLLATNTKALEEKMGRVAEDTVKSVIDNMLPTFQKQLEESAKIIVTDARDRMVLEITGESYTDCQRRSAIRDGIQYSIKAAKKSTIVADKVLSTLTSTIVAAIVAFIIGKS